MIRLTLPLAFLVLLAGRVTMARADTRVDLTPSIAYINPTQNVVDQDEISAKFAGAVGFGGRITIWLNDRVALEGSGHYGRSSLDADIFGESGSIDLALFYGSAQIAVGLGAERRLQLHAGLGMQGTNYDELIEGGNILTGVVGFSGVMPLSPSTAIRADFDMHIHTTYFEVGDVQTDELNQYDTVLALGIQFTPGAGSK